MSEGIGRNEIDSDSNAQQRSPGGDQTGGGPESSDMAAPGGSSGTGGYGSAQNQQFHQGQQERGIIGRKEEGQSRGDRFDEAQGGGRDEASVGLAEEDLKEDQAAHQDRGQSVAAAESDRD